MLNEGDQKKNNFTEDPQVILGEMLFYLGFLAQKTMDALLG